MSTRYALYAAPPADHPLHGFAARWLGWNPETGTTHAPVPAAGLSAARIAELTAEPRLYGFHGTLKPPFRLKDGSSEADLIVALEAFAAKRPPIRVAPLTVAALGSFLALRPSEPSPELDALAADCVRAFDHFRAPLSDAELARRRRAPLTARQEEYLQAWGYPYVFEEFRLHFTLTGSIKDPAERQMLLQHLITICKPYTASDHVVGEICLFVQAESGKPFRIAGRYSFGG